MTLILGSYDVMFGDVKDIKKIKKIKLMLSKLEFEVIK
jgi:hypothetical protein